MLHEIYPKIYHPEYIHKKLDAAKKCYILYFKDNRVLLYKKDDDLILPTFENIREKFPQLEGEIIASSVYLCRLNDATDVGFEEEYYVLDTEDLDFTDPDFTYYNLAIFRDFLPTYHAFMGATASHIYHWLKSKKFCGYCGSKTEHSSTERAKICRECGQIEYPKISPAIIVAIRNGDKLLLVRNTKGNYKRYALVAGFMEIGETPEDTVRREVMEEVGLKVKNIQPYKAQPWGMSDTLMLGFIADLDGDDTICLQQEELTDAAWFNRPDIPVMEYHISVGHEMMQKFQKGEI